MRNFKKIKNLDNSISDLIEFFDNLKLTDTEQQIADLNQLLKKYFNIG